MNDSVNAGSRVARAELTRLFAELCPRRHIDLAGAVSLPCEMPLRDRFTSWCAGQRHGGLDYMVRAPEERLDPTIRNPEARTMLVFAQRYTSGWPDGAARAAEPAAGGSEPAGAPWTDRVSRYARGRDYHDVLLKDIRGVLRDLGETLPGLVAHASTDTGPYLERENAWLAGLGFLGKNTCLIHERLGSGLFLGVAITNLAIDDLPDQAAEPLYGVVPRRSVPPAEPYLSACGSCTRCIDACPTDALLADGGLDAGRCLSNFTIEQRGETPTEFRAAQGGILFGCDICQAVCPWNARAAGRAGTIPEPRAEYGVLPAHADLALADLVAIDDAEFRRRFRRTPIWRCHPEGLRRNAATVLENLARGDK